MIKLPSPQKCWHIDACGLVVALAIALCAYLLLLYPAQRQRERVERLQAEGAQREQRQRELESELHRSNQELSELARLNAGASVRVDGETRLNQRIAALSDLAAAAGLSVDVIEPGLGRSGALYHVTPIQIAGKGRYRQVRDFISSLHQGMPDVPLTSMTLSAAPSTTESTVFFNIELLWHTAAAPRGAPAQSVQLSDGN